MVNSYQHSITGDKTEGIPDETGGGILADEMGLGKTLSVISTIIRTAPAALLFADGNGDDRIASGHVSKDFSRIQSRSTLVLVPSPCK
jgi:SNF2 family DNA or RNA helicase